MKYLGERIPNVLRQFPQLNVGQSSLDFGMFKFNAVNLIQRLVLSYIGLCCVNRFDLSTLHITAMLRHFCYCVESVSQWILAQLRRFGFIFRVNSIEAGIVLGVSSCGNRIYVTYRAEMQSWQHETRSLNHLFRLEAPSGNREALYLPIGDLEEESVWERRWGRGIEHFRGSSGSEENAFSMFLLFRRGPPPPSLLQTLPLFYIHAIWSKQIRISCSRVTSPSVSSCFFSIHCF